MIRLILMSALSIAIVLISGCAQISQLIPSDSGGEIVESAKVTALFEKAQRAQDAGGVVEAKEHYEAMLAAGARSSKMLNHYAVFLRKQFEIDEAATVYKKALNASPKDAVTHYNLAILYELYRGDFVNARKHYQAYQEHALEPDPSVKAWIADLDRRIEMSGG